MQRTPEQLAIHAARMRAWRLDNLRLARKRARDNYRRQKSKDPDKWRVKAREYQAVYRKKYPDKVREQVAARRLKSPFRQLIHSARWRARKKGLPFKITARWAEKRWTGYCELSGIKFRLTTGDKRVYIDSPSIDRTDPRKGYTYRNCRFILWGLNRFKGDSPDHEALTIIRAVVEFEQKQKEDYT